MIKAIGTIFQIEGIGSKEEEDDLDVPLDSKE
jgi:hypothetical protein